MNHSFTPRAILAALITLFAFLPSRAQVVSSYTFGQSSGTYTPITGGTVWGTGTDDDQRFVDPAVPLGGTVSTGPGIPIGFNFTFNGQCFDRFAINNNGWICLGNSTLGVDMNTSSAYTPLSSTAANTPTYLRSRIAAIGRDLQGQAGAQLRSQTIGSSPNQVCVIQWTGYKRYSTTGTGDNMSFQIRLNEGTNTVDLVYGSVVFGTTLSSGASAAHVGLGGSVSTDYNNRITTASPLHNWNATSAGGANNVGCNMGGTGGTLVTPPASGLTFTWTPPCTPACFSMTTVPDCANNQFSVSVNLSTLGSSATVDITGPPATSITGISAPGVYVMGPYASGTSVTITIVQANPACNSSQTATFTCPVVISSYPYCQTFNAANGFVVCNSTSSCFALTCPLVAAQGWVNDNTEAPPGDWYVLTGPSGGSTNTGPGAGDNPNGPSTGTGNYLMIESGSCTPNRTIRLISPAFDVSGFTGPARATLWYHMWGATMGSLSLQVEDPALSGSWTTLWSRSGDNGDVWAQTPNVDYTPTGAQIRYRVLGVTGTSFTSDMAIDDFCMAEGSCTPVTASGVVNPSCGTNQFYVDVTISNMGDATSVDIVPSVGSPINGITTTGTYSVGPFSATWPSGSSVSVSIAHSDPNCNAPVPGGPFSYTCPLGVTAPYCDSFDSYATSSNGTCNVNNTGLLVGGWWNATVGRQWQTTNLATTSSPTGPDFDHTTGAGNYVYSEGTTCTGSGPHILVSPAIDVSGLTQPLLSVWYHMYGTDIPTASLLVQMEEPYLSGTWVTIATITETTPGGVNAWQQFFSNVNPGGSVTRFRFFTDIGTSFLRDIGLDDFCVVEAPTCTAPTANFTVVNNCPFYNVQVEVLTMGDALTLDLISNHLGVEHNDITAPGIYMMGPYCKSTPSVDITVQHNGDPIFCSLYSTQSTTCASPCSNTSPTSTIDTETESIVMAGNTTSISLLNNCTGGVGPLGLQSHVCTQVADVFQNFGYTLQCDFGTCGGNYSNRGAVWADWNGNGVFEVSEEIYTYCAQSPGPGLVSIPVNVPLTSVLGTVTMRIQQQEGPPACPTPLDPCATFTYGSRYDVSLNIQPQPSCTQPSANLLPVPDCQNAQYSVNVDLTSLGDATTVDITSNVNGLEYDNVAVTGLYLIGPFPDASSVTVSIVHNDNNLCSITKPPFTYACGPSDFCGAYSTSPNTPIPDVSTITSTIATGPMSGEAIVDLDVVVVIDHTYLADLDISLTSPMGTVVKLMDDVCIGNDNMEVIFDDEALTAVACATPTIGRYRTSGTLAGLLSGFDTELFEGTWTLTVTDDLGGDTGTLLQWCLVPTLQIPDCPNPSALAVTGTTVTTATLDWTSIPGNTGYTIEYGPPGFILGTGTTVSGALPPPATVTGLTGATTYQFWLRETCPAGSSLSIGPVTATTAMLVSAYPYCQDFESFSTCATVCATPCVFAPTSGWQQVSGGTDWLTDAGGTPTAATGPTVDHTLGTTVGKYVYLETNTACQTQSAVMLSPLFDVSGMTNDPVLSFWYHMHGAAMGRLTVEVEDPAGSNNWVTVFTRLGQDQTSEAAAWKNVSLPLSSLSGTDFRARFTGQGIGGFTSDMAVDDICVTEGPCQFPQATYNVVCAPYPSTNFTIEVSITSLGSGTAVDIIPSTGTPITGADGTMNPYVLGPFTGAGTLVDVTLSNTATPGCTATSYNFGCAPANDDCTAMNPAANPIGPGQSLQFNGFASGSTIDPPLVGVFSANVQGIVWEAFTLTQCADVRIDFCSDPLPVWGILALNMYSDCSGASPVNSQSFNWTTCTPNNGQGSVYYLSLNPGTYFYPVLWSPANNAQGAYVLNVSATTPAVPCTPNTCAQAEEIVCGGQKSGTTVSNTATQGPSVCLPNQVAPGPDAWYFFQNLSPNSFNAPGDGSTTTFDLAGAGATMYSVIQTKLGTVNTTGNGSTTAYDLPPGTNAQVSSVLLNGVPQTGGAPPTSDLQLTLLTDNYGGETTWTLTGPVSFSGGPYASNSTFVVPFNDLPNGSYTYTILDSFGDGICCGYGNGSYTLTNLTTSTVIVTGGAFTTSQATPFTLNQVAADYYLSVGTGAGGVDQVIFNTAPGAGVTVDIAYTSDVQLTTPLQYSVSAGTGPGGVDQIILATAPLVGESLAVSYGLPAGDQLVTASTCAGTTYNSMLTVYAANPDCSSLVCVTGNDNNCGVATTSEVNWIAQSGVDYYIAVHGPNGYVGSTGAFTLSLVCAPPCTPQANDVCASATAVTPVLDDGLGVMQTFSNVCSFADANPSCDISGIQAGRAQGVWFSFNTGPNEFFDLQLATSVEDPLYTATAISYAVYSGACGSLMEVACDLTGTTTTTIGPLNQYTDHWIMVFNDGGIGLEGSFGLLLTYPAQNDASITDVIYPDGLVCTTQIVPTVELTNLGFQVLTSVDILYDVDGGTPQSFTWTGSLNYLETELVELNLISTTPGPHTFNAATSMPNGVADEIPANDAFAIPFDVSGEAMFMVVVTDRWGSQATWQILDAFSFPVASGGPYADLPGNGTAPHVETLCLPTDFGNCYSLYLYDSFGDGICCQYGAGSWEARDALGRTLIGDLFHGSGTATGSSIYDGGQSPDATPASANYNNGHSICLPSGPSTIDLGECEVFTNTLQQKVYTSQVAGASLYQFEFSDPDAGLARRIAVPRRWVKFSEMVTLPLPAGTTLFCRARVDQGASGFLDDHFGAGCELGLAANAYDLCTQLIDDISLPTHSCGVTRSFGGGDKLWAYPVVTATQYRFQFENTGEGYLRNIIRPTYVCLLSWATAPLVNGSTYAVRVQVFVAGAWRAFCGADCNVTILNPPMAGGSLNAAPVATTDGLQLWPNPVRDGNVNLLIEGIEAAEQHVTVEVFDAFGRRVHARDQANSGEVFNTILELGTDIAPGIYEVRVRVNDSVYLERLTIQ